MNGLKGSVCTINNQGGINMKKTFKEILSLFLVVAIFLSIFTFYGINSSAATAGNYSVKLEIYVEDNSDSDHVNDYYYRIYYKSNNGTGTETDSYVDISKSDMSDVYTATNGTTKYVSKSVPGFPWKVAGYLDCNGTGFLWANTNEYRAEMRSISIGSTSIWTGNLYLGSTKNVKEAAIDWEDNATGNDSSWGVVKTSSGAWKTSAKPYANSITAISGSSSISVNKDGSTTNTATYTAGTVKDQYSVNWYQNATLASNSLINGVSYSSGTVSVPASSNRSADYTVSLKETCGSAKNTKNITIKTFDYSVTFYDEDGSTELLAAQTVDYNGSATAPEVAAKYSSSAHRTFKNWTGDSYSSITSGAQNKSVVASYNNSASHTYNSGEVVNSATCTEDGITKYTCNYCDYHYNDTTIPVATGHTNCTLHTKAVNSSSANSFVKAYYICDDCGKYIPAVYSNNEYAPVDTSANATVYNSYEAVQESDAGSGNSIPCPAFNILTGIYNYNYSTRGASLKIKDPDYVDKNTRQGIRFAGSVNIPVGVDYNVRSESANKVIDFGFVYSQTELIDNNIENLVEGAPNVYKSSVVANNADKAQFNDFSGVSYHSEENALTFNLLINIKARNWTKDYCARTYIRYIYNGIEYTVYDSSFHSRSVKYIAQRAVQNPLETETVRQFCQTKILNHC